MTIQLTPVLIYSIVGHASILGVYAGITWATLRRHGHTLERVADLLENHGTRLARLEGKMQKRKGG